MQIIDIIMIDQRVPRWLSGKESSCQYRRPGFDPWVRKIPWSRKWQPTPGFLPGKSHGQRNLAGYSPQGCKELDMTELLTYTHRVEATTIHFRSSLMLPHWPVLRIAVWLG